VDATLLAEELGNERTANVVLLGAVSAALEFAQDEWESGLAEFVPGKTLAVNVEAFRRGRAWIERARRGEEPTLAPVPLAAADPGVAVRLEITRPWCKSCDICVKLCPERCLRLDDERIVELADPLKCTGCRLCEWLCPDFAIRVHIGPAAEPGAAGGAAEGARA
jgi:indolepyruvate ferredoxin oxidoreductase beta subunit